MAADHAHNGEIPVDSAPPTGGAGASKRESSSASSSSATGASGSTTGTSDRVAAATRESIRTLKMSSVGIELALSVLIGLFAGRWLDGKLGTSPWLMIVLLCLGFAAGLRSIVRTMDKASKASSDAEPTTPTDDAELPKGSGPGSAA